ncbi:MAG: hypothetical protein LBI12_03985, partial [Treponema sp.]|nr:hypothetical protein [Treponema sp.]
MLLTIDIGTSKFKTALWDYEGNRHFYSAVVLGDSLNDGEKNEVDCNEWLKALKTCLRELKDLKKVKAIVICGNGPSLVPVLGSPFASADGIFVPAEKCRLWLDRRAVKYTAEVSALMGGFVDSGFFLPKILGIKNDENELYSKVKYFLGCPEYLAYALTGEGRTVFPSEGFDRWFWNDSVLEKLELDKEKFPPFIRPGDLFGFVSGQAASCFGFAEKTPVVSGGPDFFAAILGAGVTEPFYACDRTGSSEGINLCTQEQVFDKRLMSYRHPVKPYWNLSGIINTTGRAIQWGSNILGLSDLNDFFTLAKESKKGSGGLVFVPYLAGERSPLWDPSVRGLWKGLSLSQGRSEIANSVLEGIGFAIRDVLGAMKETGEKV